MLIARSCKETRWLKPWKASSSPKSFSKAFLKARWWWWGGCFIYSSVQFSRSVMSNCLQPHGLQHTRPPCPSPTPEASSNSYPSSRWCHPTISSSVIPFSCIHSFPESWCFPMSQFFASGGQSTTVAASASVLPMNTQNWFHLGLTGLISLQSKGLSRVFSNTTVQKLQFFSAQLSFFKKV